MLLRGHSGGKVFKVIEYPDGFRSDVHFWNEMRIWAAMAKAYADLGGDSVKDLAKALLFALTDDSDDKQIPHALRIAKNSAFVVRLIVDLDVEHESPIRIDERQGCYFCVR